MPLFEASPSGGGAHVLLSYATGFWGPHDALHTFCEESYAVTSLAAEPFNAFGSFCYTVVGVVNLWRLSKLGLPLSWRATCGWWSLVIVGLGSSLFHTTMRYHMELLDEIPMLVLVCCGCLQCSDIHPLGKYRWKGITLLDLTLVGGLSVLTVVYLITRIFGLFVTGFTIGTIFLLGLYMTAERNPDYGHLGGRAAVRILLARVAWELCVRRASNPCRPLLEATHFASAFQTFMPVAVRTISVHPTPWSGTCTTCGTLAPVLRRPTSSFSDTCTGSRSWACVASSRSVAAAPRATRAQSAAPAGRPGA